MKSLFTGLLTSILTLSNIQMVNASIPISIEKVETTDLYTINQDTILDGIFFENIITDNYTIYSNSIWWTGTEASITVDLGTALTIQDVLIEVDTNDYYHVDYSLDEINWSNLFTIIPEDGEIFWGMDTMSSDSLNEEYIAIMDFSAVEARYLRISASGGDNVYHLTELQLFGNFFESSLIEKQPLTSPVSPVPAPPSLMLFGAGLMMLMGLQYRRKNK